MSTLGQIIGDIEQALRHAPAVEAHREELIRRVNRKLAQITVAKRWTWRQRLVNIQLRAKIELTIADLTQSPGSYGAYSVGFALPSGWDSGSSYEGPNLLGAKVTIDGTSAHDGTYVIENSQWDSGLSLVVVHLDARFIGDFAGAMSPGTATFVIEFDRYRLPGDYGDMSVAQFRAEKRAPMREVTLDQEEHLGLNEDETAGTPECFLVSPNRPRSNVNPRQDYLHVLAEPPHEAPSASAAGAAGAHVAGDYDYCWSWAAADLVSPPSPTVRVTVTANQTVTISDLVAYVGASGDGFGWRKLIWRRRVYATRNGPWYLVATGTSAGTTATDSGGQRLETLTRMRDWPVGDSTRFIRFWPPTSTDRVAEVRYLSRARDVESETDEPEMPDFGHDLLVYGVVMDLAAEAGAEAVKKHHEKLYKELWDMFCRRGLTPSSTMHRRRSILGDGELVGLRARPAVWNG